MEPAMGSMMTVQIGNFSNFVGAHWWNLQECSLLNDEEEIDHGLLFRRGLSRKNSIDHSPRLLAIDLKGSVGSFSCQLDDNIRGDLSDNSWRLNGSQDILSNQDLKRIREISLKEKDETKLEESTCSWTDFSKSSLHSQSTYFLPEFQHKNTTTPFNLYPLGKCAMENETTKDTIEDQVRRFVEECDYLQGFQIISDAHDGFSGVTSRFLQHLCEEYSNKTTIAFPILPTAKENTNRINWLINSAFLMNSLFEDASMLVPISLDPSWASTGHRSFKNLHFQPYSVFHQSAIIASMLDTATFPLRRNYGPKMSMLDLVHSLVQHNRKAVGISGCMPILERVSSLASVEDISKEFVSLTPHVNQFNDSWAQSLTWRGVGEPGKIQSVIDQWADKRWNRTTTVNTVFRSNCLSESPYPQFFKSNIGQPEMSSFAIFNGLHSSSSVGTSLKQLHTEISKIDTRKLHRFTSSGMDSDDFSENRNTLLNFIDCYSD